MIRLTPDFWLRALLAVAFVAGCGVAVIGAMWGLYAWLSGWNGAGARERRDAK